MRVVFVHGACVRDGAWWWHRVAELLVEHGIAERGNRAAELRRDGRGADGARRSGTGRGRRGGPAGAERERGTDHHGRPQLRGIVTAEAAAGVGPVRHCCWCPATFPRSGRACRPSAGRSPLHFSTSIPRVARSPSARSLSSRRSCRTAMRRFRPRQRTGCAAKRRTSRAAGEVSRVAAGALDVPRLHPGPWHAPRRQHEFARRAGTVVDLDTGHHPFLSQPAAVRDLIVGL